MVEIHTAYEGQLHCTAKHGPSGATLATDAPVDNHGRGESFSPTDLVATALGTCILTTMGIAARKHGWLLDGIRVQVQKHMTTTPPRRIARLPCVLDVPSAVAGALSEQARAELEAAALGCPVKISLAEVIDVPIEFRWGV
jgi:putative redox protein